MLAGISKGALNRCTGRSSTEEALLPRKPPAHQKRVTVRNRYDLVDVLEKQVLRHKVLANPFDLVGV